MFKMAFLFLTLLIVIEKCPSKNTGGNAKYIDLLGEYKSYRWIEESITELTHEQANSFLGKTMKISAEKFILFSDTILSPLYSSSRIYKEGFFRKSYKVDWNLFEKKSDSINIIDVKDTVNNNIISLIVTDGSISVNRDGYFYLFRKS